MKPLILFSIFTLSLAAQSNELGLSIGRIGGTDTPSVAHGTALQANYAHRLGSAGPLSLFAGVNLLANPQRKVTSANLGVIRDLASLYITPELKVQLKFSPLRPYLFAGGGLAVYEHSTETLGGAPNPGPRTSSTGAFTYGGGLDISIVRWVAFRGEIRDNYSGAPTYNIPTGKQHNTSLTAGLVLRWGD